MKQLATLILYLIPIAISCQFYNINTFEVEEVPCTTDPSTMVFKYANWELYQTEDDNWNGKRYEGSCPDLTEGQFGTRTNYQLDLSTIDHTKPLFLAYKEEGLNTSYNFPANNVTSFDASLYEPSGPSILLGSDCLNDICSGVIIRSVHIDPTLSADSLFCTGIFPFQEKASNSYCWATEKTFENKITDIIYKIAINEPSTSTLTPASVNFFEGWETPNILSALIYHIPEAHNNQGIYDITVYDLDENFDSSNSLVTHNVPGLPSSSNQSFTEIQPELNPTEAATINLNVSDYTNLNFQKFSHLIGGLIEGSDTERHNLNIILESNQCLFIVELIGTGGTNFKFSGGQFEFNDVNACLQLRDKSSLIIDENEVVRFGQNGIGNLNLRSGSNVILEAQSEMTFDGKLFLNSFDGYRGTENIHVDLQPNSHLTFTEKAKVINDLSEEIQYLYVHMNGGDIDISKLSEEDKRKIILVFPENSENVNINSYIFPNPCSGQVNIYNTRQLLLDEVILLDMNGQRVLNKRLNSDQVKSSIDISDLTSGMYLLNVISNENRSREIHKLIVK